MASISTGKFDHEFDSSKILVLGGGLVFYLISSYFSISAKSGLSQKSECEDREGAGQVRLLLGHYFYLPKNLQKVYVTGHLNPSEAVVCMKGNFNFYNSKPMLK